ncbi:MAG: DCC1-like thiol-disulfide oxidoreductase family protein [Hyphomonadaceae bacterium]
MAWEAVAAPKLDQDLIVFDGDCVLCSYWARFVHERDIAQRFKFVAIQSPFGRALAARFGVDADAPQTNLAAIDGRAYFKSDAAIEILGVLPGWRWARVARFVPRTIRNWLYDIIARRRYRWFGRKSQCWAGDPAFAARILDAAP